MLKGHVFNKQLFEHPVFAVFVNTFLNGTNGISNNYKEGMNITQNGNTITVFSGLACVQGRFIEEDTYTSIAVGANNAYCKLVLEIDLDKENTESELKQLSYKIVKSTTSYPSLTQNNIVKNNMGVYQYELARFRTTASGITDFKDMRTFLDFNSIYDAIKEDYREILVQLQQEFANVQDGSAYLLKSGGVIDGEVEISASGDISGNISANARKC